MRQWLTILAIVWAAVTLQAAEEGRASSSCVELRAEVFSMPAPDGEPCDDMPLLGIASTAARQLSGAGQMQVRSFRSYGVEHFASIRTHACGDLNYKPAAYAVAYVVTPPCERHRDRYIYFLRRIII